ncbi:MAG: hypothetical protein ACOC5R_00075 [Elusimicrobiota bacterium]
MGILEFENFDIEKDELEPGWGIGWDWGAYYDFSKNLKFSFVIKDFLSTLITYPDGDKEVIKGRVSLGSTFVLNEMITLTGDLRDIKLTDIGKSTFFTKLYMGGEANLSDILKVRGGFYQGYPSFGFGLGGILDYAFYARELSVFPGLSPEWNHVLSISMGF